MEITVQVHEVALGNFHTSVRIVPQNQDLYANDPRFQNTFVGEDGNTYRYATLGAGPEGGDLVSNPNRAKDLDQDIKIEFLEVDLNGTNEDEVIEKLFETDANYQDNLDYDLFPANEGERNILIADDGHNSNSYVSGLLESTNLDAPIPNHNVPGYDKPVPAENFEHETNVDEE